MSQAARKGPSPRLLGCGALLLFATVTCGWCGLRTSRGLLEFKRFEHTPAGTPVSEVVTKATALGFERWPSGDVLPDDAGVETLELVKLNGPPVGSWHLQVHHVDGGVTSVTTWIPD